jgi:GH35 family endo-1,4-beta-xylanase
LEQIDVTFDPSMTKSTDIFVTLAKQHEQNAQQPDAKLPDDMTQANNHVKAVACWGLTKLKDSYNAYAQREYALFLTGLEQAASHLERALKTHANNPGSPPAPATQPTPTPASTGASLDPVPEEKKE